MTCKQHTWLYLGPDHKPAREASADYRRCTNDGCTMVQAKQYSWVMFVPLVRKDDAPPASLE